MQELDVKSVSDYVSGTFGSARESRGSELMTKLIEYLHDYIRDVELSHTEWALALAFLRAMGDKTNANRNEFMLLSDVSGVSTLVDLLAEQGRLDATPSSPLGPYYLPDAPLVEQGALICRDDEPGTPTVLKGRVSGSNGKAIEAAMVDIWHNADSGLYSNEDDSQDAMNNRGRIYTDANGEFLVRTIRPRAYSIPMDGPVGELMRAFNRSPWRTAHFHMIVSADGYESVTTELFFSDCEFINKDAVAGVRASLVHDPIYEDTDRGNTLIVDHHFRLRAKNGA